jgi:hypothetical protein
MIDVEPRADLRARVEEKVASYQFPGSSSQLPGSSSQLPAFSFQRFGVLVAAAALLVPAVILVRRAEPPAQAPAVARAADQPLPTAAASAEQPAPQRGLATQPEIAVATPQTLVSQTRRALIVATTGPDIADQPNAGVEPGDVEPLRAIAPIAVAPIAHSNITPDPIAVNPLPPITEMQIAPLNPPDGRN